MNEKRVKEIPVPCTPYLVNKVKNQLQLHLQVCPQVEEMLIAIAPSPTYQAPGTGQRLIVWGEAY